MTNPEYSRLIALHDISTGFVKAFELVQQNETVFGIKAKNVNSIVGTREKIIGLAFNRDYLPHAGNTGNLFCDAVRNQKQASVVAANNLTVKILKGPGLSFCSFYFPEV